MSPKPRGQNLVVLALSMLLITLMVLITLGLSVRVRENHELQNLADASAYSSAVVNARAFNNIALLNRLQVSYWVAMAADQSLISWTGWARGAVAGMGQVSRVLAAAPCAANNDEGRAAAAYFFSQFDSRLGTPAWDARDTAAGTEALAIQGMIGALRRESREVGVRTELFDERDAQRAAQRVVDRSRVPGLRVLAGAGGLGPNGVSRREVDCDQGTATPPGDDDGSDSGDPSGDPLPRAGICSRRSWNANMVQAAMGSRGNPFVTSRGVLPPLVADIVAGAPGYVTIGLAAPGGSAYWAANMNHGAAPEGTVAWGDDHGSLTVTVRDRGGVCSQTRTVPVGAWVRSTHAADSTDQHFWIPMRDSDPTPIDNHTMGSCGSSCPSVWVRALGFQPNSDPSDNYGQPKVAVALERNVSARTDPWELNFRFRFGSASPGVQFDNRGEELRGVTGRGTLINRAVAVATGTTYYHRSGAWEEFPNLLNPYWRATLTSFDVDADRSTAVGRGRIRDEAGRVLSQPEQQWQRQAFDALFAEGYEGLH